MRIVRLCCVLVFAISTVAIARCDEPVDVTVCELKANPANYNHRVIRITGFVSHAFEDFTIFDPNCPSWPGVWLEYGGKSKSGTMYCCGVTADRSRPKELVIEHLPIPLVSDEQFQAFDKAIQPPFRSGRQGAIVQATLVGTFFAGKRLDYFKGKPWGGFGHMGCCTLLAIQQVVTADTQNRDNLDYGASADQPDIEKAGCGYQDLLPLDNTASELQWQRDADNGKHDFAFDDPQRVASETLAAVTKGAVPSQADLKLKAEAQGRRIFEYKPVGESASYMVVVSRPYVTSFYSRDPNRVAWVAIAAYRSSCGGKNAITRIK